MDKMCAGIDDSVVVIVFVTNLYVQKVAGKGRNGTNDNCKKEFEYACRHKGIDNLIVVEMEPTAQPWKGPVGLNVGNHKYYTFHKDSELNACVSSLIEEMKEKNCLV